MITTESMYQEIGIRPEVLSFGSKIETALKERFDRIDETAEYNQLKVIHAMQKNRVCAGLSFSYSLHLSHKMHFLSEPAFLCLLFLFSPISLCLWKGSCHRILSTRIK